LGGTAPRLRSPFPGLPKLLLTATHLVYLSLYNTPRSGYIPPDVMATSLSALTSLESLHLQFRHPRPRLALESRRPRPLIRSILPSLTKIRSKGASEYLEEILARIDAPRLNALHITFFNQIIFDTPQLFQFISRRPTLRAPEKGRIAFIVILRPLLSNFHHRHLTTMYSAWKSNARLQNGSFRPLNMSVPRPCLPFPHWGTFTS
jgi:hypothetical protein